MSMERRQFFCTTLATAAAAGLRAADEESDFPIIDSNVSLFRWPFRRLPLDETAAMVRKMRSLGVSQAFAGSFEGIFERDLARANRRLTEACADFPELIPIGSVNPNSAGWENDLRSCAEKQEMPGIRLHPNYHDYSLDAPCFRQLLSAAAEAGVFVQVATTMEDRRTQNALAAVPDVNLTPLPAVMGGIPGARIQLLNWRPRSIELQVLAKTPGLLFDTARVDGTDGIVQLRQAVSADRVLFGSHAPFLIPEAALIRFVHEAELEGETLRKIAQANAERLLSKTVK